MRLYEGLAAILAGDETALHRWMHNQNVHLRATPIERITTIAGLTDTVAYVDGGQARV